MSIYSFGGKCKLCRNLAISESLSYKPCYFFFTRGKRVPLRHEVLSIEVLYQASSHQVRSQFVFRLTLALGKLGNNRLQIFCNFGGSRAIVEALAYPIQQALPDRH